MASRGRGSRNKGATFERELAKRLSELTGMEFKRGLGQARSARTEGADVQTELPIHIEAKRHKKVSIKPAVEQAFRDCGSSIPIIITKDDHEPELVTMKLSDWEPMFLAWIKNTHVEPSSNV